MAEDPLGGPDDEFRELLRRFLSGQGDLDPAKLAGAAGLPTDPLMVARLLGQLQKAMNASGDGVDWSLARDESGRIAAQGSIRSSAAELEQLRQALNVAALWLDEATSITQLTAEPTLITRADWARLTLPVWTQLAEPVADSIAASLTSALDQQVPEELKGMVANAGQVMRSLGGTLFSLQLGHVVGQLSAEVVSGGDIGIPLLPGRDDTDVQAALLPQNVSAFGVGLDIAADQVQLYLAVRELAHARLFRHARWLRQHLVSAITDYARGISIDTSRIESLAAEFDPANPESLREALTSGALIPPKTDAQLAALGRLETTLALIDGWVDVVTARATARLPKADAIAETVRRRRAAGGPAESAFATLVGLELRPRRLREAAAFWARITDEAGADARDSLWAHPDLLPTADDIDDPSRVLAVLAGDTTAAPDALDEALSALLADETGDRPIERGPGEAPAEPDASDSPDDQDGPAEPTG
ncbi:zinc-dependent metalloprotease [Microcella frigidaquae]|uniref:Putative hydrolase n=1 Tax=Microcella frigidaquae TaxID=424758 RepID=A0A840XKK3_9MICO|nr:zinc-dependent metalloprotease [Microcella frigidaquae]MBB5617387.1 putative hydrolase [Microcella frigidaquae]NHN45564.1 zinc-dependent metalloprotease [Microcella frigidaquae]